MVHPVPADPAATTNSDRTGGIRIHPLPGAELLADVLLDIARERARQHEKYGDRSHPDADPVILARLETAPYPINTQTHVAWRLAQEYEIPTAGRAQQICRSEGERGQDTWTGIALEEFCEAVQATVIAASAPNDPNATGELYDELIQAAAMLTAWAQDVARRRAYAVAVAETGADNAPV